MAGDDLFTHAGEMARAGELPLAERLRPTSLDEVVGQARLVGPKGVLRRMIRATPLPSMILRGGPGTGKTTLARLVCDARSDQLVSLSAVSATVSDVRREVDAARQRRGTHDQRTVVFLDEIHRFTRTQQDALLPAVESGVISLVGATTESPWATLVGPLLSRCTVLELEPLGGDDFAELAERAGGVTGVSLDPDGLEVLRNATDGDARRFLVAYEVAAALAGSGADAGGNSSGVIDAAVAHEALGAGDIRYGHGAHYDAASAFIKWMRRGDVDQAVAWMLHMLDAGDDPRFVARRMVIFASEDVGSADPRALLVADAAARAVEGVGMPEAVYNLAQSAEYLARAAKSRDTVELIARGRSTERCLPPEMMGQ